MFFTAQPRRSFGVVARKHAGGFVRHGSRAGFGGRNGGSLPAGLCRQEMRVEIAITEVGYGERN